MSKGIKLISCSPEETISYGYEFAKELKPGDIAGLFGNLGSGKTQFVKGICGFFNVKETVSSPTFIIVNEYSGFYKNSENIIRINHFDLYRLKNISELKEIGLESYVNDKSVCIIEWPEFADQLLRGNIMKIYLHYGENENERIIEY